MGTDLGSAFGKIILDAQQALDETQKVGRGLSGLAGPAGVMAGAIGAAGIAAGGAIIALGASSVGVAREFESAMAVMSTAVDPVSVGAQTSAEAMAILGDASLAVGSDTALVGVSASSAAEAMTGLYKAGLSTGEIFGDLQGYLAGTAELSGALRASIDLAAASELDMVQASELAAVTLATFGGHLETEAERAEFMNQAMNNFVQTADGSVASVSDLAAAFTNIGSTAAGMGIPLEDVNTALGILSTRGIAGSEAGTAVKSMLTNMMTAPKAAEALDELGVSLYDVTGTMRPLEEIIGDLEGAMAGMTDEQRTQTTVALASSYGQKALNALLAEGATGWADMETAIAGAATIQETAAARTNTLAGAQEALSGVMETFRIKIGTALIPVLTTLADIGASLLEKYGPTMTAMFENIGNGIGRIIEVVSGGKLGELFTVFEDGSSVLGSVFEAFGMGEQQANNLATGISNVVTSVSSFLAPIANAVTQFFSWKDVLLGVGIALGTVLLPAIAGVVGGLLAFFAPIAAVIGVVALLRNAWENNWGGIQEKVSAAVGVIRDVIGTVSGVVQSLIGNLQEGMSPIDAFIEAIWDIAPQPVIDALVNFRDNVLPGLSAAFLAIQTRVGEFVALIGPTLQTFLTNVGAWWNATWPQLQTAIQTVWGIVQSVIQSAIAVIGPALQGFLAALGPVWENLKSLWPPIVSLWEAAKPVLLGVLAAIGAALVAAVGLITGVITGLGRAIGPIINGIIGAVKGIVTALTGVFQTLQGVFRLIVGLFTGNGELIQKGWEQVKEGVTNIVGGLVDGVLSLFSGLVNGIVGFVTGLVDGVIGFFQNLYDRLVGHSIITDLVERIESLWEDLWAIVEELVQAGVDAVQGIIEAFVALFTGDWEGFKDKIAEVWQAAWDTVIEIAEGLWERISTWLVGLWQNVRDWFTETDWGSLGTSLVNGLIAGVQNAAGALWDAVQGLIDGALERIRQAINPGSPSRTTYPWGESIGEGLIAGVRSTFSGAAAVMDELFSVMGNVSGLAGSLGGQFDRRVLTPLQNGVAASEAALASWDETMNGIAAQLGYGEGFLRTPAAVLELQRRMNYEFASPGERAAAQVLLSMMAERNRMNLQHLELQRQLEQEEARRAALQRAQNENDFLQEQLKLIQLIRDNGLGADLLAGLRLGLGADAGQLMDVMREALQRMIAVAEAELGIASPSKVARKLMGQWNLGLIAGMDDNRKVLTAARDLMDLVAVPGRDTAGSFMADGGRTAHLYGGQHIYIQRPTRSVLDDIQVLLAP